MPALLLIFIFIRPFISSLAFPRLNAIYSVALLAFLGVWVIKMRLISEKLGPIKYPLLFFSLSLIISGIFSVNPYNTLLESYKYATGILLFLAASSLTPENSIRTLRAIVWAALIISFLAAYQYFFGFQNLLLYLSLKKITDPFVLDYISRKRVFFPFVTPNILAGYLIMAIPLTFSLKKRILYLIPLTAALLLTESLGAMLSLFAVIIIFVYLRSTRKRKYIFFLSGMAVVIGLIFVLRSLSQSTHLQPAYSTAMRLSYWTETIGIIKSHFLFGVGIGNFNLTVSRYAHNSYLQLWAEAGILGLILFLWLVGAVLRSSLKRIPESQQRDLIVCLFCANLSFLLQNFVDFTFYLPEISLVWWAIMGLLYSSIRPSLPQKLNL
jgi:O-antigen ligase